VYLCVCVCARARSHALAPAPIHTLTDRQGFWNWRKVVVKWKLEYINIHIDAETKLCVCVFVRVADMCVANVLLM
jgi:hypothetical protein